MFHQKQESYKYVLPLENWVDKMSQPQEMYSLKKSVQKLKKKHIIVFSYDYLL